MAPEQIRIIQKGPGWICVEKPAGLSVHNDPGADLISLLSARPDLSACGRLQPVHRLDRETSGLLLLATDSQSLARLSDAFARGKTVKCYQALVHGNFPEDQTQGEWQAPLTKEAGGRTDPAGKGKKVAALTRYTVVSQSIHYALLDIELFTGRKHQIRRHAKLAGHPVVGDSRYGSARAIAFLKEKKGFFGLALHASGLSFEDNGTWIRLESQGLPRDIRQLLDEDGA